MITLILEKERNFIRVPSDANKVDISGQHRGYPVQFETIQGVFNMTKIK